MKSIKNIALLKTIALVLGVSLLNSCDIESELLTNISNESFYQTQDDAYDALVACYDGMQIATGGVKESFYTASEVGSDDCFGGTGISDGYNYQVIDEFDISRAPSYTDLYNNIWINYYRAIYRCNVLLQKMDQITWDDDNARAQYEAEAKFIRAYSYFDMVRLWGNIPLVTEPTTDNIPQSDPDEVYTVIAEDLLYAAENLPDEVYSSTESGRITRWAAKSMLARVYLYYTGYYSKSDLVGLVSQSDALDHLEDVIASSGHALVSDFGTLWEAADVENYAGENNEEIVFAVKYTYTSNYTGDTDGNLWKVMFGMRGLNQYPYGQGWGVTVNSKLYDLYDSGDSRRWATVISVDDEDLPVDITAQREYTGYYNKKYTPLLTEDGEYPGAAAGGDSDFQLNQMQDYFVIRYADVLLMASELGSTNAQTYFDEVRHRALGNDYTQLTVTQDRIMEERHKEFALEGIRYWDLLRQGVSTAANTIGETTTVYSGGVETTKTIDGAQITATQGLFQIPNTQISLSGGVLQQNTGW
ncbi:membrane protein [Neptunitalea chrysea]|uniref:Membrane protein n=1 Tax=Neptunitalea chrysea TaxID=1647581 RepID=A0A9W6ETH0_9FLAO|nr:RagB/SusD family nutrient uptake outer membrane protein [Neptunitalea chrysea]GLB51965.1 membrane protein [Neptunitalea chrysea]